MKKIGSVLAALCVATAFCGFCTACGKHGAITPDNGNTTDPGNNTVTPVTPDTPSNTDTPTNTDTDNNGVVGEKPVVILLPGDNYKGNTKVLNKVAGTGITALTKDEAGKYYVENAYFCDIAANSAIPTPTSENTNIEFVRWRYADEGVEVAVGTMPSELTKDIILIAEWKVKSSK